MGGGGRVRAKQKKKRKRKGKKVGRGRDETDDFIRVDERRISRKEIRGGVRVSFRFG